MTPNGPSPDSYRRRRETLLARLNDAVLFLPPVEEARYSNDVHYRYRPDSDTRYLSGFEEPCSLMLVARDCESKGFSMFVRERDPQSETWTGRRAGLEGARETYGADNAWALEQGEEKLEQALSGARTLYYGFGRSAGSDSAMLELVKRVNAGRPRSGLAPLVLHDSSELMSEMRLFKSDEEAELMRRSCAIAVQAHIAVLEDLRPGHSESDIEAGVEYRFRRGGCSGPAYGTIAAAGNNATVLHYTSNLGTPGQGDLVLLDAGGEYGGYAADITSTFPMSADWTDAQAELYDLVLAAQRSALAQVKPGSSCDSVHQAALGVLVQGMHDLGLLEGSDTSASLESGAYQPYYMHRTSHWLGMDVHDVGSYRDNEGPRPLAAGMVLTVEPGIYVRRDSEAPERFRGIGIRLEDDVLVTADGSENLTAALPRDRDEISRIRRAALS